MIGLAVGAGRYGRRKQATAFMQQAGTVRRVLASVRCISSSHPDWEVRCPRNVLSASRRPTRLPPCLTCSLILPLAGGRGARSVPLPESVSIHHLRLIHYFTFLAKQPLQAAESLEVCRS